MSHRYSNLERPGLNERELVEALCAPRGPFSRLELVNETGSTNTDLVAHALEGREVWPDLSVLTAEMQTAGRGRLERTWTAPERSSIIVSVLLRPANADQIPVPTRSYSWLSLLAALSLVDAVRDRAQVPATIKWPNDVQVDDRKLAGLLAQMVHSPDGTPPAVVVGAGVNVCLTDDELPVTSATSLLLEYATTTDRNILLKAYLRALARNYRSFCDVGGDAFTPWPDGTSLAAKIAAVMNTIGEHVRAELPGGEQVVGYATGLDRDGCLQIRDNQNVMHTVSAGDVVHLRRTGP
ncbi:biotin--[acetyl-CoA-carboxylase] ligase [Arthrobacter roseus]|uniref:biotin--[acetyl-CoA-carboxylase] ligase n=1 Tax=Arthrobacter roseus TaxID=136274 RepID=UPI001962665D|nr:biotin--[acetyl-CoA-carboxylase] ligase [Arthrobacter roseus]MBM7848068.1 BirA family biotin operon repressor/biotin-[acetyl-CoA-carboxylase] ligase [Arthrobacter roseus]